MSAAQWARKAPKRGHKVKCLMPFLCLYKKPGCSGSWREWQSCGNQDETAKISEELHKFVILTLSEPDTIQPRVFQAGLSWLRAAHSCLQEHLEKEWISGGLEKTKAMALERRITIGWSDNLGWKGPREVSSPISCSKQGQPQDQSSLVRTLSSLVLKISKDGACATAGQPAPVKWSEPEGPVVMLLRSLICCLAPFGVHNPNLYFCGNLQVIILGSRLCLSWVWVFYRAHLQIMITWKKTPFSGGTCRVQPPTLRSGQSGSVQMCINQQQTLAWH